MLHRCRSGIDHPQDLSRWNRIDGTDATSQVEVIHRQQSSATATSGRHGRRRQKWCILHILLQVSHLAGRLPGVLLRRPASPADQVHHPPTLAPLGEDGVHLIDLRSASCKQRPRSSVVLVHKGWHYKRLEKGRLEDRVDRQGRRQSQLKRIR